MTMYVCTLCSSGIGSGGLLFNHPINWFADLDAAPEECPQCGSGLGVYRVNLSEPVVIATLCDIVRQQHGALMGLREERGRLLARAAGVDLEEVLRLDREALPGPWFHYKRANTKPREWPAWALADVEDEEEHRIAAEGEPNDIALIAHYRTAAPALAREVVRLREALAEVEAERDAARAEADAFTAYRSLVTTALGIDPASCADDAREAIEALKAAVRFADEQGAEAIARVAANIVADKWAATAAFQARASKAEVEIEELRLTLAAERGDPAGAPSPGWEYGVIDEEGGLGWRKPTADGMLFAWGAGIDFLGADHAPDPHPGGWTRWVADEDGDLDEMPECVTDETWTARAAMIAADEATT